MYRFVVWMRYLECGSVAGDQRVLEKGVRELSLNFLTYLLFSVTFCGVDVLPCVWKYCSWPGSNRERCEGARETFEFSCSV